MLNREVICAGYFISRIIDTPPTLNCGLLPARILTVSSCLTDLFPDVWALEWASCSDDERKIAAEKFSISAQQLPDVVRFMTDAFDAKHFGWPSVWQGVAHARSAAQRFLPDPSQFALVGIGVLREAAENVQGELAPNPMEGESGWHMALSSLAPLEPGGEALGWDVLGFELGGGCHSWLCNSLHVEVATRLGIKPGALGLLDSEAHARAVVAFIDSDRSKAEPVPWYPVWVVRYPL